MEFHLRISATKNNGEVILKSFCASFKPVEMVSAYENKGTREDGTQINPHYHSYIKYGTVPTKQALSSFFKKQVLLKPTDKNAGYSHKIQKTTKEQNIIYTIKGGDIIINTIGDDILSYKEKTELINDSKKLSSKEKLYNIWLMKKGLKYPESKFDLFKFIDEVYVLEWNKTPLASGHMNCYSRHILLMIHKNIEEKDIELYETLLLNIYSIRDHIELLHDINRNRVRKHLNECEKAYSCADFIDE